MFMPKRSEQFRWLNNFRTSATSLKETHWQLYHHIFCLAAHVHCTVLVFCTYCHDWTKYILFQTKTHRNRLYISEQDAVCIAEQNFHFELWKSFIKLIKIFFGSYWTRPNFCSLEKTAHGSTLDRMWVGRICNCVKFYECSGVWWFP